MTNSDDCSWSVYVHTNRFNNKHYVGVTHKQPEKRWQNGYGYKTQPFFNAIQKYGWENFDHEIVAGNLTKDEALNFEQLLIEKLDSFIWSNGYNASIGGGVPAFEATPIVQFDLRGNFIAEYDGIYKAERKFGIPSSNIVACCNGTTARAHGYIWKYKRDVDDFDAFKNGLDATQYDVCEPIYQFDMEKNFIAEYPSACAASKHNNKWLSCSILENCRGKYKQACGYIWKFKKDVPDIQEFQREPYDLKKRHWGGNVVLQFDLDGRFIREFSSAKEAAKLYGCDTHTITYACSGRTKSGVGYLWRYKKDYNGEITAYVKHEPFHKRVSQYDLLDNFIAEYESVSDAARCMNVGLSCIRAACNGRQKTAYGYKWKYIDC